MPMIQLSAHVAATAKCSEGRPKTDYYDTQITGFVLECRVTGGKTWALRYRDSHNRQRQYKIGDAQSISYEKARVVAQTLRAQVVLGGNPTQERQTKRSIPTIEELAQRYFEHVCTYKRSHDIDARQLKNHILPKFGKLRLDELEQGDVQAWLLAMRHQGYAGATVNRWLVIMRYMYRLAQRWGVAGAEKNPMVGIDLLPTNGHRERFLSAEETQRLRVAVERSENPQLKYIVALALLTGARKRELLDARWDDVDLDRRTWRVPMTKSGKPRHVPLSSTAVAVIKSLPRWVGCPYLLPNPVSLQPYVNFFKSWDTARQRAGLPEVRVHDLRHSAASYMANAGQSLLVISKVLGHSQIKTTQIYSHLAQDTLLAAVDAAADGMGTNWAVPQRPQSE